MQQITRSSYKLSDHDTVLADSKQSYVLRFKDLPDDDKPREKLLAADAGALSLKELLAIIWVTGSRNEDVLQMAQRTLKEYGEGAISNERSARRLADSLELPINKACQLVACLELGRRLYQSTSIGKPIQVRTARQAFEYVKDMGEGQKEQLRGLYLNSRYQVVHDEVISIGSLTSNIVHPREVFRPALERSAVAVIIAHNHPSGRLQPTRADVTVTKQLIAAGEILGIELLDHLIVTAGHFRSVFDDQYFGSG